MKLTLRLRYRTDYGQDLFLLGNHPSLGGGNADKAIPLQYLNRDFWQVTIDVGAAARAGATGPYEYLLRERDGSTVRDCGAGRSLDFGSFRHEEVLVIDAWNSPGSIENALITEPFRVLLRDRQGTFQAPSAPAPTHTISVRAPLLTKDQTLCLLGDSAFFGNWNTTKPVLLSRQGSGGLFTAEVDLRGHSFPIVYKYGVFDLSKNSFLRYEDGENRILDDAVAQGKYTILNDGFAALPANTWKGAGVAIPVFSLRSESGFGVGEFADLKLLVDWGKQAGLSLIQLLPINDTTATHSWMDSYPYSAISAFALHPLYLNLARVASRANRPLLQKLEPEQKRLNALDFLDYQAVMKAKVDFLKRIFPSQKTETLGSAAYREFFRRNRHWLEPYAAFCCLRDRNGTADFGRWPEHRRCNPAAIAALTAEASPARDEMDWNYFIQFHLHQQLKEAVDYAHENGIVVKGDLPIGVFRNGADAWQDPDLYHMEFQAGAPPDPFSDKGQNWSFPTYNWPRMRQDGYAWWRQRLVQMSVYFDAFRIDHILGFFRIWSIPWDSVEGLMGFFMPAIPVEAREFKTRGIWFDRERYTRPFITDEMLRDMFENDYGAVQSQFLNPGGPGGYSLKPRFDTQRKIEAYFAGLEQNPGNARIKQGLYDLAANVILFEIQGSRGEQFHMRFFVDRTSSFKALPAHTRSQLTDLSLDYFWRRQDDLWRKEGMDKLPVLKRVSNMLVCGEDLGMVPACVPDVMKQLGLLSLEVQRMPKALHQDFSRPANAPYLSVVTPSTHDMSTIRGWWEEDRAVTRKFYNQELEQSGEPPRHCEPWVSKAIVRQHLASPAMWSIFQLQDLLGMNEELRRKDIASERINVPADPKFYWRYRMHLTLEKLLQAGEFNRELRELARQTGRG